ncbi:uncharacterized protein ARMOST_21945 [Armillaria ostoyae]|uniref:F-box domain-containing protein n=1 Tax=Armillaria ostoyae TaxID=47428 RepID=A0A284SBG2_ARMOS|nr:uncharacterized protein ARMOST_21945 [Armillaria ostoyae]
MSVSDLPPEIRDAIIDELQGDKKSLLRASLVCRAFCPRTRVHLFSIASLTGKSDCDRLRELITLSPQLALHFKFLHIAFLDPIENYGALTVIESLIDVTRLSLAYGDWRYMPHSVVSSLQSHSYRIFNITIFQFTSIGEICSLLKNSPNLERERIACKDDNITGQCTSNHSLRFTPAPAVVDVNGSDSRTILKSVLSSSPCLFSCSNIDVLKITLRDANTATLQCLKQYLARSHRSLKHLHVTHLHPGFATASSETLHVSSVEQIEVTTWLALSSIKQAPHLFEWWISNLSAVNEHCAIRSFMFTFLDPNWSDFGKTHPAWAWEDLWMRLDGCLSSSKMTLLERVAITFLARPTEWNVLKTSMEKYFVGLKQLGCEVALNAGAGLA